MVEPLSIDEAYLDVTMAKKGLPSATLIAKEIMIRIFAETGLTASAGVSYNKFLAKVASDVNKPNGIFVITPNQAQEFIDNLEVKRFFGIGKVSAKKLNEIGIWFGRDLKQLDRYELIRMFGKAGNYYFEICRGDDNRVVQPSRERKSVGAENTFLTDLFLISEIEKEMLRIAETLWSRIEQANVKGKTLTLKYTYSDFEKHTRSKTVSGYINSKEILVKEGNSLLKSGGGFDRGIRLLGLTVSNFIREKKSEPEQLTLEF